MKHVVQEFQDGTDGVRIDHVLGQFQVSSVRIQQGSQ